MRFQCRHCQGILDIEDCEPGEKVVCGHCGQTVEYPLSPTSPTAMLGDFAIIRELGEGGMGKVYLARQVSLDRNVALKILSGKYAENITFIQNFIHEARVAASLNHPNIIQAYAVSMENGLYYFAMEYVEGKTLKQILQEQHRLPAGQVLQLAIDVVAALEYAWKESRLLHRDIKPDNIMITQDGRTKLADLGLAMQQMDQDQREDRELYGTPQYVAPELLLKHPHDPRCDMYSLGATLYQALTGEYPYMADDVENLIMEHGRTPLRPVASLVQEELPGLATVIEKLLAKRPVHRYVDFECLQEDLMAVKNGAPLKGILSSLSQVPLDYDAPDPLALPEGMKEVQVKKKASGGKFLLILGILVLLGALAGGAWYFLRGGAGKRSSAAGAPASPGQAVQAPEAVSPLSALKQKIASEGFSEAVQKDMAALCEGLSAGSPEYDEYMKLCADFLDRRIGEAREEQSRKLTGQWQARIEAFRIQKEKDRKAALALAEKKRLAREAEVERRRLAAEAAKRAAEILASKQKTVEDMVFYTRNFDFDSAIRGFKMLSVELAGAQAGWTKDWIKCLENAAGTFALIHDSGEKFAGTRLMIGQQEWTVEEIIFNDLKISASVRDKHKKQVKVDRELKMDLLSNLNLRTLCQAALEKAGRGEKMDEYFGCLLWCRGGAEGYARKALEKSGGYAGMLKEEKMIRRAYVRGWLRLLGTGQYNKVQVSMIERDLKRRYAEETREVEKELAKVIGGK